MRITLKCITGRCEQEWTVSAWVYFPPSMYT